MQRANENSSKDNDDDTHNRLRELLGLLTVSDIHVIVKILEIAQSKGWDKQELKRVLAYAIDVGIPNHMSEHKPEGDEK